jgi:hypothetical protein
MKILKEVSQTSKKQKAEYLGKEGIWLEFKSNHVECQKVAPYRKVYLNDDITKLKDAFRLAISNTVPYIVENNEESTNANKLIILNIEMLPKFLNKLKSSLNIINEKSYLDHQRSAISIK